MGLRVYWECCNKDGVKCADAWYREVPDGTRVSEDRNAEIWWYRSIKAIQKIEHNRPDVTVTAVDQVDQEWTYLDFLVLCDRNAVTKEYIV